MSSDISTSKGGSCDFVFPPYNAKSYPRKDKDSISIGQSITNSNSSSALFILTKSFMGYLALCESSMQTVLKTEPHFSKVMEGT